MERSLSSFNTEPSSNALLKSQVQRLGRVLAFSGEFASAIRREFAVCWTPPARGFGAKFDTKLKRLVSLADSVLKQHAQGNQVLENQLTLPPLKAMALLGSFPVDQLIAETKGLDALARELRAEPALKGVLAPAAQPNANQANRSVPQTSKLVDGAERKGGWTGWLQKLTTSPSEKSVSRADVAASHAATQVEKQRHAFHAARELVMQVIAYVSPRMLLVSAGLSATGLPGPIKPWPEVEKNVAAMGRKSGVPPAQLEWVSPLAKLFCTEADVAKKALVAENQFKSTRELLSEADILVSSIDMSPGSASKLLEQFSVERFKGSVLPLSHLHLTFKGIPVLEDLFPPKPRTSN